ncbi:thiamine diphosphokinase [Clostridium felsineum]|uniref:thiamine diphosphokinase n=1 Tax=Clostridium felsineum TaxID=36839 RepID=UPI00098BD252|nr:thiamine diphosphokinase [Clostridium felsineum]URZ00805.1 Thiamine pyrophosphokinase [Clostridium felsineum]
MKVVVISGGKMPSEKLLYDEIEKCEYIICADSGANCLYKYKISPNILVGDFDSIDDEIFSYFKNNTSIVEVPCEKDFTDTELAFNEALKLSPDEISFLGCTGTRLDHIFGNLGLLYKCIKSGIKASIKDDNNTLFMIDKTTKIQGEKGEIFSIQGFRDEVKALYIENAKYPLKNYNLNFGDSRTVSNEFLDEPVTIRFENGIVIVMKCTD